MKLDILYEDNHLIAVNKGNSDLVQGDKTGDEPLSDKVKAYIKKKYNKPGNVYLGVIHRLDRPVTGIVIFAKTSKALTRMNKIFQEQKAKKIYWAVVKNLPQDDEAILTHYMRKDGAKNKSYVYDTSRKDRKKAVLEYKIASSSSNYYLLEVDLITGRHHQVRAQLAKIGSPIKGDLKYGFARSNKNGGITLHARSLSFTHPVTTEEIKIVAPTPKDEPLWREFKNMI